MSPTPITPSHPWNGRYVIAYFPAGVVHAGVNGGCGQWAIALHRRTGWNLGILWEMPAPHRAAFGAAPLPIHVFCLAPDGRIVDVEGAREATDMKRLYRAIPEVTGRLAVETYATEARYRTAIRDHPGLEADEAQIASIGRLMRESPAFLNLLTGLAGYDRDVAA